MRTGFSPVIVGEIGSHAHGLATPESDHDYMGIYIEPKTALIGLEPSENVLRVRDKPEGVKSAPGDEETSFYPLRKYVKLACEGNPTILTLLFTPTLTVPDQIGLQANRHLFLSKQIAARHIGYAEGMRQRITGERAPRTNRPELIAKHGWDTKAGFHAIRLLIQGAEMLETGNMTMPMELFRWYQLLMGVRNGQVTQSAALATIEGLRWLIADAEQSSPLPDRPDMSKVNAWLVDTHETYWHEGEPCAA